MRKLNVAIIVGAVVAILGAALVFAYGHNVDSRIAAGRRTIPVLTAVSALTPGMLADELPGKVQVSQVPEAYVPADALTDLQAVRGLQLLGPVPVGGQLSKANFGSQVGADVVKPAKGKVALAVGVGVTPGVARYVTAGSYVDVLVTYANGGGAAVNRTKLFQTDVKVMSVSVAPPTTKAGSSASTSTAAADSNQVVAVLEVTPKQAEQLVNAGTLGSLYLALSAQGDPHRTAGGTTPDDVVRAGT